MKGSIAATARTHERGADFIQTHQPNRLSYLTATMRTKRGPMTSSKFPKKSQRSEFSGLKWKIRWWMPSGANSNHKSAPKHILSAPAPNSGQTMPSSMKKAVKSRPNRNRPAKDDCLLHDREPEVHNYSIPASQVTQTGSGIARYNMVIT